MVTLVSMTVGKLVKDALKKRGLSQIELSQRSSVSPAQISRIVNDERGASLDTLIAIADALGIKRDLMLRTAAGLPTPEVTSDEWVRDMNDLLNKIKDPRARGIAEKLLDSLALNEEESAATQIQPKKAKGHA